MGPSKSKVKIRLYWRRFVRLQRLSVTTRRGVLGLIAFGGITGLAGIELYALGIIEFASLRALVYFALVGAGLAFWFLYMHYCYASTLAYQDVLTGLSNRKAIISAFKKYQSLAQREGRKLAVVYMDLDSFKPVNDEHGHDAGDELLQRLANVLQMTVRESDIVARIGGDEFIILMTGSVTAEGVNRCVDRLRKAIERPIRLRSAGGIAVNIPVSMGIAIYPDDADDMHALADIADQRMFEEKRLHHER